MERLRDISGYRYRTGELTQAHEYILPYITELLASRTWESSSRRLFDLGCGNGSVAGYLSKLGYSVVGVDPSIEGIEQAHQAHPELQLSNGSAYDDLAGTYGQFEVVISIEVVEHLYNPRKFATEIYKLLEDGGVAIISTPYHGYWKNLAIALLGKFDAHFTALWDHGHIKFWSMPTLAKLLKDAGFSEVKFHRVGRWPAFAKCMIAIAKR